MTNPSARPLMPVAAGLLLVVVVAFRPAIAPAPAFERGQTDETTTGISVYDPVQQLVLAEGSGGERRTISTLAWGGPGIDEVRVLAVRFLAPQAARFAVDSAGDATMFVNRGSQAIEVSSHAARRMTQRGISIDVVESTLTHSPFQYFHQGVWKSGYYDPAARTFIGTVDDTVTTVIDNASPNYIQNLRR